MLRKENNRLHWMVKTGLLAAVAFVLMYIEFPLPIAPPWLKLDISDFPALLAGFALGPVSGCVVEAIKVVLFFFLKNSGTGGVGELCNFLMGLTFVVPAGLFYRQKKNRWGALWGSVLGAVVMAVMSFPINYFISYPFYVRSGMMSMEAIMDAYQLILPSVQTLPQALLIFNIPFTLVKAACDVAITFAVYKRISPLIHGQGKRLQA